jgi:hypothetical protein
MTASVSAFIFLLRSMASLRPFSRRGSSALMEFSHCRVQMRRPGAAIKAHCRFLAWLVPTLRNSQNCDFVQRSLGLFCRRTSYATVQPWRQLRNPAHGKVWPSVRQPPAYATLKLTLARSIRAPLASSSLHTRSAKHLTCSASDERQSMRPSNEANSSGSKSAREQLVCARDLATFLMRLQGANIGRVTRSDS